MTSCWLSRLTDSKRREKPAIQVTQSTSPMITDAPGTPTYLVRTMPVSAVQPAMSAQKRIASIR